MFRFLFQGQLSIAFKKELLSGKRPFVLFLFAQICFSFHKRTKLRSAETNIRQASAPDISTSIEPDVPSLALDDLLVSTGEQRRLLTNQLAAGEID